MVKKVSIETMIDMLRYKAENIKAHIEPEFFNDVTDVLEREKAEKINKVLPVTPDESENECPNCGNTLDLAMNEFNCEYCHWCGKKLDWSD